MDVIAAYQHGIFNSAATLGTSLTPEHVYKLRHWVEEAVFTFDADEAGGKATARGIDVILSSEIRGKVCMLPKGQDPEDVIRRDVQKFIGYLGKSVPILDWIIDHSMNKFARIDDRIDRNCRIIKDLVPIIMKFKAGGSGTDSVRSYEIIRRISEKLDLPENVIVKESSKASRKGEYYTAESEEIKGAVVQEDLTKEEKILKEILHILIKYPQYIEYAGDIPCAEGKTETYGSLLRDYLGKFKGDFHGMYGNIGGDRKRIISQLTVSPINSDNPMDYILGLTEAYKKNVVDSEKFEKIAREINILIKENKPVSKSKRDEYNKLKKKKN
jgi:hypothetical protein